MMAFQPRLAPGQPVVINNSKPGCPTSGVIQRGESDAQIPGSKEDRGRELRAGRGSLPTLIASAADALLRLHYHEGYHNGQIGLLRRLVGKEGAIK
jgi:hypothetical protein